MASGPSFGTTNDNAGAMPGSPEQIPFTDAPILLNGIGNLEINAVPLNLGESDLAPKNNATAKPKANATETTASAAPIQSDGTASIPKVPDRIPVGMSSNEWLKLKEQQWMAMHDAVEQKNMYRTGLPQSTVPAHLASRETATDAAPVSVMPVPRPNFASDEKNVPFSLGIAAESSQTEAGVNNARSSFHCPDGTCSKNHRAAPDKIRIAGQTANNRPLDLNPKAYGKGPLPHASEIQRVINVGLRVGKNLCGRAVWQILRAAKLVQGGPNSGVNNAKDFGPLLARNGFIKDMSVCNRPGVVRIYGSNASGQTFRNHMAGDKAGHIEIYSLDHEFHSFFKSGRSMDESMKERYGYSSRRPLIQCWYKP